MSETPKVRKSPLYLLPLIVTLFSKFVLNQLFVMSQRTQTHLPKHLPHFDSAALFICTNVERPTKNLFDQESKTFSFLSFSRRLNRGLNMLSFTLLSCKFRKHVKQVALNQNIDSFYLVGYGAI